MILVTGGTGFLGSYIIKNLIEKNIPVRALRRTSSLPFYIQDTILKKVEWVDGDLLNVSLLQDAVRGVQGIIHAAAVVSFSPRERHEMYQVNIEGTCNIVNAAIDHSVQRFLHVSSVAALGRKGTVNLISEKEKWTDNKYNTYYSISKHHAEMHIWRGFAEGLKGVIINPSTILGFGDWHRSSCALFKNAYREFNWYTKGINGFVGVEDVAEVAVRLLQSNISEEKFIVNADNWTFQHLFNTIADHFHKKRPERNATKTLGEVVWRIEKIKELLIGKKALLTKETAKVAHSRTSFDNQLLLRTLPDFQYMPLEIVIERACHLYVHALETGILKL